MICYKNLWLKEEPKYWQCPYCLEPVGLFGNWFAVIFGTQFHGCSFVNVARLNRDKEIY